MLDEDNRKLYRSRAQEWKTVARKAVAGKAEPDIMELSENELGALKRYKSFGSYMINDALRNADSIDDLDKTYKKVIQKLDFALSKMPTYNGNLLRTVDFKDWPNADEKTEEFLKEFIPGKRIRIKQYWSVSKTAEYNESASIRIYIQDSKNGRYQHDWVE